MNCCDLGHVFSELDCTNMGPAACVCVGSEGGARDHLLCLFYFFVCSCVSCMHVEARGQLVRVDPLDQIILGLGGSYLHPLSHLTGPGWFSKEKSLSL